MIFRVQKKITSESKYKSQKTFTTLILGVCDVSRFDILFYHWSVYLTPKIVYFRYQLIFIRFKRTGIKYHNK